MAGIGVDKNYLGLFESLGLRNFTNKEEEVPEHSIEPVIFLLYHVGLGLYYLLAGFGFFGNAATIFVLVRQGLNSTTAIFLCSLSVLDFLFTVGHLTKHCYLLYFRENKLIPSNTQTTEFFKVLDYCNIFSSTFSYHIIALISVERLFAVFLPLYLHKLNTPYRMKCVIILLFIYCGIVNSFDNEYSRHYFDKMISDKKSSYLSFASAMTLQVVFDVYRLCLISTVPLTVVLLCTSLTILKLLVTSQKFKNMSSSILHQKSAKEMKVVKLLLTVCVVFVALLVPATVLHTYVHITWRYSRGILLVLDILHQMSASVNFIIYVKMNARFFNTFRCHCREC
ncbi:mas-related G-protein coupled receptor member B5-like [Physella acuta]|uniref:mas-related G-protein coupled receptor member B5-like n=1 Tax=Physella acuta TaxID=109671 RepID=UPI0027DE67B2|nr:mas-related G-protein coupled receptor member B5-like [Physella acuta]